MNIDDRKAQRDASLSLVYVAPPLLQNKGVAACCVAQVVFGSPYDARADVYSFGIVMAEMLCCRVVGSPMTTKAGKTQRHGGMHGV